jgi:hypothetical protein
MADSVEGMIAGAGVLIDKFDKEVIFHSSTHTPEWNKMKTYFL